MPQSPLVIVAELVEQAAPSAAAHIWLQRNPRYRTMVADSRRLRALLRRLRDDPAVPPHVDMAQSLDDFRDEP